MKKTLLAVAVLLLLLGGCDGYDFKEYTACVEIHAEKLCEELGHRGFIELYSGFDSRYTQFKCLGEDRQHTAWLYFEHAELDYCEVD